MFSPYAAPKSPRSSREAPSISTRDEEHRRAGGGVSEPTPARRIREMPHASLIPRLGFAKTSTSVRTSSPKPSRRCAASAMRQHHRRAPARVGQCCGPGRNRALLVLKPDVDAVPLSPSGSQGSSSVSLGAYAGEHSGAPPAALASLHTPPAPTALRASSSVIYSRPRTILSPRMT